MNGQQEGILRLLVIILGVLAVTANILFVLVAWLSKRTPPPKKGPAALTPEEKARREKIQKEIVEKLKTEASAKPGRE